MFHQIFLSPQVKRIMIISNKHGIYELPHELLNKIYPHGIFAAGGGLSAHTRKKKKLNFFHTALFHTNTKVCLIYFGQDCLWKQYFVSNLPQVPSTLICFTILVTLGPLA